MQQSMKITVSALFSVLENAADPKPHYPIPCYLLYEWESGEPGKRSRLTAGGPYATARDAMDACEDVTVWLSNGPGRWHSEDGRRLIEAA